jgi:hypothetical protein
MTTADPVQVRRYLLSGAELVSTSNDVCGRRRRSRVLYVGPRRLGRWPELVLGLHRARGDQPIHWDVVELVLDSGRGWQRGRRIAMKTTSIRDRRLAFRAYISPGTLWLYLTVEHAHQVPGDPQFGVAWQAFDEDDELVDD